MAKRLKKTRPWWLRPLIWLIWTIAIVVFLIIGLLLITQTRPFKNWVRDYAVDTANESINGTLSIERLDGNLFSNLHLSSLTLESAGDTVLSIASIRIRYDLWALLDKTIRIDSLLIDSAHVRLEELPDSTWNVMHLMPDDTAALSEDSAAEFDYAVELGSLLVRDASASLVASDSLIPDRLDGINLSVSGSYALDRQNLWLHSFQLNARNPDLQITDFTLEMTGDTSKVVFKDVVLKTAFNRITAAADIDLSDFSRSTASLVADSLNVLEFDAFLPPHFAALRPMVALGALLEDDSLRIDLAVSSGKQRFDLSSVVGSISAVIDSTIEKDVAYRAAVTLQDIAVAEWLGSREYDALLNGTMTAVGSGTDPSQMSIDLKGDLGRCVIEGYRITKADFSTRYSAGDMSGRATLAGTFGRISVSGRASGLVETPTYGIELGLSHLDLSKLIAVADTIPTDINLSALIDGTGFDPDSASGRVKLTMATSQLKDITIDRVFAQFDYYPGALQIDTLTLSSSALTVDAAGNMSFSGSGNVTYLVSLEDAAMLTDLTGGNLIGGYGQVTGTATGNLDTLTAEARFEFFDLAMISATVAQLKGDLQSQLRDSVLSGYVRLSGEGINADGNLIDSLSASGQFDNSNFDGSLSVSMANGLSSQASFELSMDSLITAVLNSISISYADINWAGGSDTTVVSVSDDDDYLISNLVLTSESPTGSEQRIKLDGVVSLQGECSLQAAVSNLELKPLAALYDLDVGGTLSLDVDLSGTALDPHVVGRLAVSNGSYGRFDYYELAGDFNYHDTRAAFELNFRPTTTETVAISGFVPVAFSLADTSEIEPLSDSMSVIIKADRLPLEILRIAGYQVEAAEGYISCDLRVTNTLKEPHVDGRLYVRDGGIRMPEYGVNYESVIADVGFKPNRITLDSLVIKSRKGKLRLNGTLNYDSSLVSGNISSSRFDAVTKDFYLVSHRDYEVQMNSEISLDAAGTSATYGGTITVTRSRFYLPAFMEMSNDDALDDITLPMLFVATFPDSAHIADSILQVANGAAASDSAQSALIENLRGSMKIVIPKNMWISSPDLKLELAGDVEVVKQGPDFELFGNIRVVRGHYQLYGKRFTVKKGELVFQGGADYVAVLDIEAAYVFRTATREKKTLKLFVTGNSEIPVVNFRLDDAEISEGDAVSYLLFGRSLDQLTQGQRAAVSGGSESGSVGTKVAAGLLAGQLSRAIGNRLNLDVIEIKAQGDLQSAAVVIGKYLTPDLFMSYQRSFGSASDDDLEPETVTLEYQLTRLIYLQLTEGDPEDAGFDVIFKLQRK